MKKLILATCSATTGTLLANPATGRFLLERKTKAFFYPQQFINLYIVIFTA